MNIAAGIVFAVSILLFFVEVAAGSAGEATLAVGAAFCAAMAHGNSGQGGSQDSH